jgi:hypothetical protein
LGSVANPAAAPSPTVPLPCPPGKCPVALVQSDTLRPADWTIGYFSPRSDIAVTIKYRTGIAAELGCALRRRQFSLKKQRSYSVTRKSLRDARPPAFANNQWTPTKTTMWNSPNSQTLFSAAKCWLGVGSR